MEKLYTTDVTITYNTTVIVEKLNVNVPLGKMIALIGSNGSGKSTILKTMSRIIKPESGKIMLDGKAIHDLPTKEVAKKLAILPQNPIAPESLKVSDLVSYGRYPHKKNFSPLSKEDKEAIAWAMEITGIKEFENRELDSLSGGQKQRAWIAMALAQQTDILFLDEPTTFLDIAYQLEIMELLKKLNQNQKRTIIMVLHDLNQAAQYSNHIIAIKKGKVLYEGTPKEVMHEEMFKDVFGIKVDLLSSSKFDVPLFVPYGLCDDIK